MKIVKDYGEIYKKYTKNEFLVFYKSTYELKKEQVYKLWILPAIMIASILGNKLLMLPSLFKIRTEFEWIFLIVGVITSMAIILDKWYGAMFFSIICLAYLVGGIGSYIDKILWAFGTIFSIRAMLLLLELKNLSIYYELTKCKVDNKYDDEF